MTNAKPVEPDVKAIVERKLPIIEADKITLRYSQEYVDQLNARQSATISQLTAERDANWNEYLEERSARMASNNREFANLQRAEAAEKRAKELEEGRDLDKVVLDEGIEIIIDAEASNKLLSERVAVLEGVEPPITPPLRKETDETWKQVISLFHKHGLPAPSTQLRDELVVAFEWAWYGHEIGLRRARTGLEGK